VAAEHTVVFDLSPTASGAYYVTGDVVRHDARVCVVQQVVRLDSTRFRATLRVLPRPTPEQRQAADAWAESMKPPQR